MDHGILLSVDELGTVKAKQRRLLRSRVRARLCFFPFSVLRHSWIGGDNGFSITCVPSAAVVHWLAALTLSTGCVTEFLLAHLHRNSAWSRLVEVRLYATVTQNKHGHFQEELYSERHWVSRCKSCRFFCATCCFIIIIPGLAKIRTDCCQVETTRCSNTRVPLQTGLITATKLL